ncbi:Prolyl 4-hydroxylase, alpha polypeptide [Cichlidogyrus casuarinus]|uniref:Prolyl 4-hydroxylase, alpha polypeptide n=1 Tax=Cichlidogyrus casuarinus TaxID=1844966 RepID=A0ABD2PJV4_9PLAT
MSAYEKEVRTYEALCRGEDAIPIRADDRLVCNFFVPHPFFRYMPIKQEILFADPKLVMWYDVLTDEEVSEIQQLSKPRLRRATVKNPVTGVLEFADYRISKSSWLPTKLSPLTMRINERIEKMTGLSIRTAEDLQVVNYGLGGHYAPHFDFGRKREKDAFEIEYGNRIATLIYYMSEVQSGGLTVFTRIGAKVKPIKNSAAFWWNLHPSGEGDLRTRHAACPVLAGAKWVMNKWFHERDQEFRRPCELERGTVEPDDIF